MNTIISIYQQLKVNEVSYETGDSFVTAHCEIEINGTIIPKQIQMSHSDLNRIISKIVALGYEFKIENINHFDFENGTEIVDFKFENVFGKDIVLEQFEFNEAVRQIRA